MRLICRVVVMTFSTYCIEKGKKEEEEGKAKERKRKTKRRKRRRRRRRNVGGWDRGAENLPMVTALVLGRLIFSQTFWLLSPFPGWPCPLEGRSCSGASYRPIIELQRGDDKQRLALGFENGLFRPLLLLWVKPTGERP